MSTAHYDASRELDAWLRNDFVAFIEKVFHHLNPGRSFTPTWYIQAMAYCVQTVAIERHYDRLNINLPPRALKLGKGDERRHAFVILRGQFRTHAGYQAPQPLYRRDLVQDLVERAAAAFLERDGSSASTTPTRRTLAGKRPAINALPSGTITTVRQVYALLRPSVSSCHGSEKTTEACIRRKGGQVGQAA